MSPNTVIGILKYKQQLDQDNAARAAEAQSNLPDSRPRTVGTYGTLANAVSSNISGQPEPMQNPPVAGGSPKPSLPATNFDGRDYQAMGDEAPSEIQQYPGTLPQLDRSNLARPVPTDLTPPPGYGQRPRLVTGTPVEEGAASPIGYNGGQLLNPADYSYLNPPAQPGFDKTRGGMTRPDLQTYEQSLNAKGEHIGRMARFGAGFKQGVRGGLVNGLIGGVVDLANPGAGNKAVYETDTGEFDQQKQAELAQERADPMYQRQLESQQLRMDQPIKLQTYAQQRALELANQQTLLQQRGLQTIDQIGARGTQAVNAIQARAAAKANGDIDAARALYSGMIDPDTGKPFTAADADQMARDDISNTRNAKVEKIWSQQAQADATTTLRTQQTEQSKAQTKAIGSLQNLRDKQGNLVQDKIDNPDKYFGGRGKDLTPNARYNAEMNTYDAAIKHIDTQVSQLESGKRSGYPDPDYDNKKKQLNADRADLVTKKEARKQELLANPAQRTGGGKTNTPKSDPLGIFK